MESHVIRHPRPPSRTRNPSVIPGPPRHSRPSPCHSERSRGIQAVHAQSPPSQTAPPSAIPDPDRGPMYTSPPTTNALSPPTTNPSSPAHIPRHPRPSPNVIPSEVEESKPFMHNPHLPKRPPIRHPRPTTHSVTPDHHREPATHPSSPTTHPSSPTLIGDLPRHQKEPLFSRHTPTDADKESVSESPLNNILSFLGVGDPFVNRIRRSHSNFLRVHTAASH